jgi:hypothetical protein
MFDWFTIGLLLLAVLIARWIDRRENAENARYLKDRELNFARQRRESDFSPVTLYIQRLRQAPASVPCSRLHEAQYRRGLLAIFLQRVLRRSYFHRARGEHPINERHA